MADHNTKGVSWRKGHEPNDHSFWDGKQCFTHVTQFEI